MLGLGPLAFAAPLALIGLIALPLLWMVLRATPPSPKMIYFAPIALLRRIAKTPETPETTPLWLIIFRLLMAGLIILGLARPIWQPEDRLGGDRPLLVIVDNSWAGAGNWSGMVREAQTWLNGAAIDGRQAGLILSASPDETLLTQAPANANRALEALVNGVPHGWSARRNTVLSALQDAQDWPDFFETVWISDGLAHDSDEDLARYLASKGPLRVFLPTDNDAPLALYPPVPSPDGLTARLVRVGIPEGEMSVSVTTIAEDGQALSRSDVVFAEGETETQVNARLPLDLRNRIRFIRVDNNTSAGSVQLVSDSWRRPRTGLIEPPGGTDNQPLLSDLHYTGGALEDQAEVIRGSLDFVLESDPSVLVMTDAARSEDARIADFIENGGVLIRFAGPRLATRGDTLLPVPLRTGGRLFGGALAWDEPQALGEFSDASPFAGLAIPEDVTVTRQVLAEPGPAIEANIWARLEDGTPLVTAQRRGEGWIVLFHVTGGPDWSNLPLSGLYPQMLGRVLALSGQSSIASPSDGRWILEELLDGSGRLTIPGREIDPVSAEAFESVEVSHLIPPGRWSLGASTRALNVIQTDTVLTPLARQLPGAIMQTRETGREIRLGGALVSLALLMFLIDILISLILSGRLGALSRLIPTSALLLSALSLSVSLSDPALGQEPLDEAAIMERALELRFGYIITGDGETDRMSAAGLTGLTQALIGRTAIEPAGPMGINLETDPLLFYPLIYWPVAEDAPAPSLEAVERIEAYLQSGGLIVFDTRSPNQSLSGNTVHPGLVRVLESIDVPPLARTPADHVLGRSFYLLDEFPGRYGSSAVWVEADPDGSSRDGTSGVVIGSVDWAGAWAVDETGRPLAPVEGGDYQRERAYRFGINLAMYAMTGNYKADQVHIPAILERLGNE